MSTSYYYLKEPVSSVRLEEGPEHDRLSVWVAGGHAGTLTVPAGSGRTLCLAFAETGADDLACPLFAYGTRDGRVVKENVRGLADDLILVDESGRPCTVREIRASGRKGGLGG